MRMRVDGVWRLGGRVVRIVGRRRVAVSMISARAELEMAEHPGKAVRSL